MKNRLFTLLLIIFSLYLIVSFSKDIYNLWKKSQEIGSEQIKLENLKQENEELKNKLEYVKTPEFVEKEARDRLGLVQEGEAVVIMPEKITNNEANQSTDVPIWKKWWQLFF
jgi:cell division protein FtsB